MVKLTHLHSLEEIKKAAFHAWRLVYAIHTCYWKLGNPIYTIPGSSLPCGPRKEVLLETDKPIAFIKAAEDNPSFYGKHGLDSFVAAYHGNIVTEDGRPTSFKTWNEYDNLLDQEGIKMKVLHCDICDIDKDVSIQRLEVSYESDGAGSKATVSEFAELCPKCHVSVLKTVFTSELKKFEVNRLFMDIVRSRYSERVRVASGRT